MIWQLIFIKAFAFCVLSFISILTFALGIHILRMPKNEWERLRREADEIRKTNEIFIKMIDPKYKEPHNGNR